MKESELLTVGSGAGSLEKATAGLWAWVASGQWVAAATRLLMAALVVAAAIVIARIFVAGLKRLRARSTTGGPLIYIVEKLVSYAVVFAGLFIGLSTLGVNLTSLTVFAGAVGVGVGLGLQGIVREFVSGLVVIFDNFVNVGDFVELENGVRGVILEVGPRATRVRTNDGLNVVIPNSKLTENQVVNWTLRGGTRRIHVPFGVAYGVDKAKVRDVVLEAARKVPFTLPETDAHKTQVWLTGFGDSSLNFELVVWPTLDAVKRPGAMNAAYNWAIEDALRAAGIEIPFPQRDLHVRSLFGRKGGEALEAMGFSAERREAAEPSPAAQASPNDAAEELMADAQREAREEAERAHERRGRET